MIYMAVGELTIEGALENYAPHRDLYVEFSAYNHVTSDDPPLKMSHGGDMTLPSKSAGARHPPSRLRRENERKGGQRRAKMPPGDSQNAGNVLPIDERLSNGKTAQLREPFPPE